MISRAVMLGCLVYTIPDGLLYRQEKYSRLIREKEKTATHTAIKSGTATYPICDDSHFKIGAAQSSFVTEIYEKSSIGYGFGAGPRAIRYSIA